MRGLDQEPGSLGVVGEERRSAKLWSLERPWGGGGVGSLQGRLGTCSPPWLPLHLAAEAEGRRKAATGRTVTGTPCPRHPRHGQRGFQADSGCLSGFKCVGGPGCPQETYGLRVGFPRPASGVRRPSPPGQSRAPRPEDQDALSGSNLHFSCGDLAESCLRGQRVCSAPPLPLRPGRPAPTAALWSLALCLREASRPR